MNAMENLARLLPGDATLDDVRIAFSWIHPEKPEYTWKAYAKPNSTGVLIDINGEIFFHSVLIGEFKRRLYYEKRFRRADHIKMEIEKAHRKHDIAKHHYRRAITLYQRLGYRYVHLDADVDGPAVWPQFGFDLAKRYEASGAGESHTRALSKPCTTLSRHTASTIPPVFQTSASFS